jgi:zinc transport system substrate-binding protein
MIVMLTRAGATALSMAALMLSACSADASGEASEATRLLQVTAAFYPLQYVAERVGGDAVEVTSLTPPGAEPHDLELTPQDLAQLQESDLVVYLSGLQPAVDEAVTQTSGLAALDAADSAHLEDPDSAVETKHPDSHSDHGGSDPHFWLDTERLSDVAAAVEEAMAEADPDQAEVFTDNLAELRRDLRDLDKEYATGLAECAVTSLVTAHESFGYLARRYGMAQVGIAGISPNAEPDPQQLASVADLVKAEGVRTIYTETLVSPAVAQTVAEETGAQTAVLDPLEGLTDDSTGSDYLTVMRENLRILRTGQKCR